MQLPYFSKTRIFLFGILGFIVLVVLLLIVFGLTKPHRTERVVLNFWAPAFEQSSFYSEFIKNYQQIHSNIRINFRSIPYDEYDSTLLNDMAAGTGPDIFMIENSWLGRYRDKIAPMPHGTNLLESSRKKGEVDFMPELVFKDTFVDIAWQDLVKGDYIYGIPLYVDTLALFYNKDIFNSVGISQPPKTWNELVEDVKQITRISGQGQIIRAGISLGTVENVNKALDILYLLMLQNGVPIVNGRTQRVEITSAEARESLKFYTSFSDPSKEVYSWNRRLHYSVDAFTEGNLGMMLGYSYLVPQIKKKNPYLNFAVAAMPQIENSSKVTNFGDYWFLTVSKQTLEKSSCGYRCQAAWDFLSFLAQRNNAKSYAQASHRPTARRDLIDWQKYDLNLGVFARQALTATDWYQPDNQACSEIFSDMIRNVNLKNETIRRALEKAQDQLQLLFRKY